jgi:crotonobetainyl-CoA:carnitine CoA-transferase CaiB-like acyl-CoA transferase
MEENGSGSQDPPKLTRQGKYMKGPLDGVRVIDLTTVAMGPLATQMLGDMGADVIKIEKPSGDQFRHAPPTQSPAMGAGFLNLNRNKRSVALDLNISEDHEVLLSLLDEADVFVTNVRPQAIRKLGLDYDALALRNPRLIYCGAYGFSESGPYAGKPAYDDIIQAMSGLACLQGQNQEDSHPSYMNTIVADKTAGITAAWAVATALFEREKSGMGQAIEVPMFETMVAFSMLEHLGGKTFIPPLGPTGYDRVLSRYRKPYRTRDGYIALLPYTTEHWERFFSAAGEPGYLDDPRFSTASARLNNVDFIYSVLEELVARRGTAEWLRLLADADIPVAPVLSIDELGEDPHLNAIGFFQEMEHPSEGPVCTVGIPVSFSRTPGSIRSLAPTLGQHTKEIKASVRAQAGAIPHSTAENAL